MKTTRKRILCLICVLCIIVSAIPVTVAAETEHYSEKDTEKLKPTVLENKENAEYVGKMIRYHILSETDDYRIARNLKKGKSIVFFFDGCSDNMDSKKYKNHSKYHLSAYCCVVKEVNGKLKIVYEDENSSTIPDNPRDASLNDGTPVPTVLDGIYNITSCNHLGRYAALHITDGGYSSVPVVRCDDIKSYVDSSVAINIHARSNFSSAPDNGISKNSFSSTGCFNVGLTDNKWSAYNKFIYAVLKILRPIVTTPYSSGSWTKCEPGIDYGCVVVDRFNYTDELKAIYGKDKARSADELVDIIVSYTKNLPPNIISEESEVDTALDENRQEGEITSEKSESSAAVPKTDEKIVLVLMQRLIRRIVGLAVKAVIPKT